MSNKALLQETHKAFISNCEDLSKELSRFKIDIEAYSEDVDYGFMTHEMYHYVNQYLVKEILRISNIEHIEITKESEKQNLWSFLKEGNFKFSTDLFNRIDDDHVIEVYDSTFKAHFRNVNFYKVTSYTVADLHAFSWPQLFKRDEQDTNSIALKVAQAFETHYENLVDFNVGMHRAEENFSKGKHVAEMFFDFAAPLERTDGARAVITTLKIKKLTSNIR